MNWKCPRCCATFRYATSYAVRRYSSEKHQDRLPLRRGTGGFPPTTRRRVSDKFTDMLIRDPLLFGWFRSGRRESKQIGTDRIRARDFMVVEPASNALIAAIFRSRLYSLHTVDKRGLKVAAARRSRCSSTWLYCVCARASNVAKSRSGMRGSTLRISGRAFQSPIFP